MPDSSLQSNKTFLSALKKVLSSLVHLVVRFGMTYPEFLELLKRVYVEEVRQELARKNEKVTLSRISVVSGVHRKDVKRFIEEQDEDSIPEKVSLTARLVSLWLGDSRFLDDHGEPKVLPRQGSNSFEELVSSVSKDVRARTILDEWRERGLVEELESGFALNQSALYPTDDLATKIAFFARNTSNHIAACDHNLQGSGDLYPERSVYYNQLSKESVDELQAYISQASQELLVGVNKKAQQLAEHDDANGGGQHRFILGTYFYREQEQSDA
ncbi:DUF6502 family protein [Marinomonas ostreistagni]|uniref:Uncharacterized protein n=1 Tax=Marinomonas ostreistagni TaxID=359209 RepID=A0ABS0Z9H2_9GAMM|nr:DUF6502 family protein [Marinomonas ostreistagni]MBJ7550307.1 hypothetical protein [Marinomonas ostreistagni]